MANLEGLIYYKYRTQIRAILVAVACFIIYIFFQNVFIGEKARIRKFILQGKRAVESKDIITCAGMISPNYQDKYGNNRSSLIYITRQVFGYYRNISVQIDNIQINLDDSKSQATVTVVALVIGQISQDSSEKFFEGEKGRVVIRLIKEAKKWRLREVEFFEPITIMGQRIS